MKTDLPTLISALRHLANDIESQDGIANAVCAEAADRIEELNFLCGQFMAHSLKMDGQHSWRFMLGWPVTHMIGPTLFDAVRAAMAEVERVRREDA